MDPNKLHKLYTEEDEEELSSLESKVPLWGWILIIVGVTILLITFVIIIFFLVKTKLQLRDVTDKLLDTETLVHKTIISDEDIKTAEESISFLNVLSNRINKLAGFRFCPPCKTDPCTGESSCSGKSPTSTTRVGESCVPQTINIPLQQPVIKSTSPTAAV